MAQHTRRREAIGAIILLIALALAAVSNVLADPTGGSISGAVTETSANRTPGSRNDSGGTITTMLLTSIQQNLRWKGYVGNVTGALSLDDAANFTIYDWDLTSFTGEVYASRYGNLSWSSVACAPNTLIQSESSFYGMTQSADDINSTFNWTVHKAFNVGVTTIGANTCNSTVTGINDTRQVPTTSSPFQEILLRDTHGAMVFLTDISDNTQGFDNLTYDFQMIVPESLSGINTGYYFYVELS